MKCSLRLASAAFFVCLVVPSVARATEGVDDLEKNLAAEHAALTTVSDCSVACRALASIRRAADKICTLDPGTRCREARAKVDDATRRVREACPECTNLTAPVKPSPQAAPVSESEVSARSEPGRGGCASCDASGAAAGDWTGGALAILALARLLRRRRGKRIENDVTLAPCSRTGSR